MATARILGRNRLLPLVRTKFTVSQIGNGPAEVCRAKLSSIIRSKIVRALTNVSFMVTKSATVNVSENIASRLSPTHLVSGYTYR